MSFVYLDHNATTPIDPRVLEKMLPYFTQVYGNAASVDHEFGHQALEAVNLAREQIAAAINAEPDEIIFTSGATESDNIALLGVAEKYARKGDHIITCVTEHKAVLDTCARLERLGKRVTYLPVDQYGLVDPEDVRRAITPQTILVSIMAANNEIGTLAPLAEIGQVTREHGVLFHTDAAQAVGHVPLDVKAMNIDILSMSAHKMYGPKGVGALYRRRSNPRVLLEPVIYGGGHERGIRSGTLNVPGIVGFGEALEIAVNEMEVYTLHSRNLISHLLSQIELEIKGISLNGHSVLRLPHNLSLVIPGVEGKALSVRLGDIALSTGSACTSAKVEPSHVIQALGFDSSRAHNTIRISVGRFNKIDDINYAAKKIIKEAKLLQALIS
ncbi:cysteine desulfurase IscS [Deinococcus indicus]|uniref:cysteine desulfurase family protein n=1 Tax=Deinococcus indicus TaxID=223556 RepID=UPI00174CA92E|nr:cysteine desulfurase family protein [Deinococcus indicus]GHG32622.1 cysteine desulfurase IscS [Deinococcus indicus]